jgi:dipeptidyl aminopeptidase/acylaminoacyl peptidase/uncharacterized protein (DUF885 family)
VKSSFLQGRRTSRRAIGSVALIVLAGIASPMPAQSPGNGSASDERIAEILKKLDDLKRQVAEHMPPPAQIPAAQGGLSPEEMADAYSRSSGLFRVLQGRVKNAQLRSQWIDSRRLWIDHESAGERHEFVLVEVDHPSDRHPVFDHSRLATALSEAAGREYTADRLPFGSIDVREDLSALSFRIENVIWTCDLATYTLSKADAPPSGPRRGRPPEEALPAVERLLGEPDYADDPPEFLQDPPASGRRRRFEEPREARSPDGRWTAKIKESNVFLAANDSGEEVRLTETGTEAVPFGMVRWSPDSRTLVTFRIEPGESKEVHLLESSPQGGGRARLQSRPYPLPGDKFTSYEPWVIDVESRQAARVETEPIDFGGPPRIRWQPSGRQFRYRKTDRGHQRFRLIEVDCDSKQVRNVIDEQSPTFVNTYTDFTLESLSATDEYLFKSERDGWAHLYLIDGPTGEVRSQITRGPWVVRTIEFIDEGSRELVFRANGMIEGEDPYLVRSYRIRFDGTGLVPLTPGEGNHQVRFSPDRRHYIDSWSRVDLPPVHELRRTSDGGLLAELARADVSGLGETGWQAPEVFHAKGRDGQTDIWGIVVRPTRIDPTRKYPVIEAIYAGPHDSHVPKTFSAYRSTQALAELGFIVVQIDGMGTANRSKAFHDVCWKNLADAGFPDRIAWIKALAQRYPYVDAERVGIYGTSAGGQNAAGAVLLHPEFYDAAVAACGCHDNRMDKSSWNEQWMGYPVGPEYEASSNITHAARLQGRLLLIVGELDTNVPPESTYRFADALIKAGKDFDLLVVPGMGHSNGGPYGDRRLKDFFVRNLYGLTPPERNAAADLATADASGAEGTSSTTASPTPPSLPRGEEEVDLGSSELRPYIERYEVDLGSLRRSYTVRISAARHARMLEYHRDWLARLETLDFRVLSREGQVDYVLLKNHLEHELRDLAIEESKQVQAAPALPFAAAIIELEESRRRMEGVDPRAIADRLTALVKEVNGMAGRVRGVSGSGGEGENPDAVRLSPLVAADTADRVSVLRDALRGWYGYFDGYDPLFTWWAADPYRQLDGALGAYAERLASIAGRPGGGPGGGRFRERGGAGPGERRGPAAEPGGQAGPPSVQGAGPAADAGEIIGEPIGREALLSELAYEMIPYTPEEILAIAEKELAWCETEMKKVAAEMGHGDDWHAALEKVKGLHVDPGKQPEVIRDLALEAVRFLDEHDLVTVPPLARESWRMEMMSPQRQLFTPFFTGGEVISVSFPTNGMTHEQKRMTMRGNNVHFSRATVHHELIPGHHLQGYMTARYRTYRRLFSTPFWGEGWALYWEFLLWDMNFARGPEDKIGMLFWRSHRAARIIFSLKFHLGEMTPQECIDLLVEKVGHERDNATAEVRRSFAGTYGPLYQAAYMLGGLQIRSLHEELVGSGKLSNREFHDAILKQGSIPIEMLRASLTAQPLTRDHVASWRFYPEVPGRVAASSITPSSTQTQGVSP